MSEIICASCGEAVPTGTKFCSACGSKIANTPKPAATAAASFAAPAQAQAQPLLQYEQPLAQQAQPQFHYEQPAQAASVAAEPIAAPCPDEKPLSFIAYLLTLLAFAVPVVGIVLAFIWAFGKKTGHSRKNFAKAQLIVWGVFFVGALVFYIFNFSALNELIKVILS